MKMIRVHVFIFGDVIGVGFRAWISHRAKNLGLTGWVRNAPVGIVEAVFEGPKEKVEEMIELCRKGPEVSWVEKIETKWEEATGEFISFDIRV